MISHPTKMPSSSSSLLRRRLWLWKLVVGMSVLQGASCRVSVASAVRQQQRRMDESPTNRFLKTIPPSTGSVVMNLLQFVVSVNTDDQEPSSSSSSSNSNNNVTIALDDLLTKGLQTEFSSLVSVDLQLNSQTFAEGSSTSSGSSGTAQQPQTHQRQELLAYSGTATFALESTAVTINQQDVQDTAAVILQDTETVTLLAPRVTSITVSNNVSNTQPPPSSVTSSTNYSGLLILLGVGSGLTFTIAIYLGYRYYRNKTKTSNTQRPPWGCAGTDSSSQRGCGGGSRRAMLRSRRCIQERTHTNELPPPLEQVLSNSSTRSGRYQDGGTDADAGQHQHCELDDFSLEGLSSTNSDASEEVASNDTQIYLAKRRKEKRKQQNSNTKKVQDSGEEDGGSDTDFSYDYIGTKQHSMECDDDDDDLRKSNMYADTEHGSIEVVANGHSAVAVVSKGSVRAVNNGFRSTNTTNVGNQPSSVSSTTSASKNRINARQVRRNTSPDDSSMERPFDEAIPIMTSSAEPWNESADDRVAKVKNDPPVIQSTRPKESCKPEQKQQLDSEEEEGLSSFLRGRRHANRAARALRDMTKE